MQYCPGGIASPAVSVNVWKAVVLEGWWPYLSAAAAVESIVEVFTETTCNAFVSATCIFPLCQTPVSVVVGKYLI